MPTATATCRSTNGAAWAASRAHSATPTPTATSGFAATSSIKAQARDERVKAAETAGDAWVSAKVTAALLMDRALTISDMRVVTRDGRVRLSGVVRSDGEAQAAERIAWRVEGVRAVVNSLSVRPSLSAQGR